MAFSSRHFLVLLTLAAVPGCGENQTSGDAAPAQKDAAPPQAGFIVLHPQSVPFTSSVPGRTLPSAVAEIRPQVNGIVRKRVFQEGKPVNAGDVLYEIDDRSYRAALDSAKGSVSRAEAAVANAQAEFDRTQQLASRNVVAEAQVDTARAALLQARADVETANAAVDAAQVNLDNTKVTAPISGLIGTSTVTEGALVTANQTAPLATIRQIDPMYVDLTDSSANLLRIRRLIETGVVQRGSEPPEVRLTLEDGTAYNQTGTVLAFERAVSETTASVTFRSTIPNPDRILLPGMYVRAVVSVGSGAAGFLVPQRAVSRNAKGQATAAFVGADGKAEIRLLTTDQSYGNFWVVREGVADGDRLIVDGLQRVRGGQPVTPIEVRLDEEGLVVPPDSGAAER